MYTVRSVRGWVQVWNYNVCVTCRCWGGTSSVCAVEDWVGDCGGGVENISSYCLHEKRCVVLVGRLIRDFVYILITNFCALIIIYS